MHIYNTFYYLVCFPSRTFNFKLFSKFFFVAISKFTMKSATTPSMSPYAIPSRVIVVLATAAPADLLLTTLRLVLGLTTP
jgi:hypothetical protein